MLRHMTIAGLLTAVLMTIATVATANAATTKTTSPTTTINHVLVIQGSVESTIDANGAVVFRYKLSNRGNSDLRGIALHFDPSIRPWGFASGHLVVDDLNGGLDWYAHALKPGESETFTIPVQVPRKGGPGTSLCAGVLVTTGSIPGQAAHISPCLENVLEMK